MTKNFKIFCLLILITLASCSGISKRKLASVTGKPRHIIFLVHGIAANEKTFGYMKEALEKNLNNESETEYTVQNYTYETINNKNGTEQFAQGLGENINNYFAENGEITDQDKISIIAHSQGGIVSLIWIYKSILKDKDFNAKYLDHLDSYITLGTPYWGAKIASFGSSIKKVTSAVDENAIPEFGSRQLNDMTFGSPVIFSFRKSAIDPNLQEMLKVVKDRIHPINFGGAAVSSMKLYAPFSTGAGEYEDDSAVPLPSSRFDFIYASSFKSGYAEKDVVPFTEFKETHFSQFHVVDALHVSAAPNIAFWAAIASIPKNCINNSNCSHPTFKYILAHLKHDFKTVPDEKVLKKMTGYLIDLNVQLPEGETMPASEMSVKLETLDPNVRGSSPIELYNHGHSEEIANGGFRHFYFTGVAKNNYVPEDERGEGAPFKDGKISLTISAPGYKTRVIEAKVRPTYSTFIEMNLEKN